MLLSFSPIGCCIWGNFLWTLLEGIREAPSMVAECSKLCLSRSDQPGSVRWFVKQGLYEETQMGGAQHLGENKGIKIWWNRQVLDAEWDFLIFLELRLRTKDENKGEKCQIWKQHLPKRACWEHAHLLPNFTVEEGWHRERTSQLMEELDFPFTSPGISLSWSTEKNNP